MRYLLDTQIVVWMATAPVELPERTRGILASGKAELYVSAVSPWEIVIKHQAGKLPRMHPTDFFKCCDEYLLKQLPIEMSHTRAYVDLPLLHKDPFDRMLIAQAKAESLTLISQDMQMRNYDVEILWS